MLLAGRHSLIVSARAWGQGGVAFKANASLFNFFMYSADIALF
jgi:hypothetical protein